jgi:dihydroxyacetone kinase-like predicted kinase
VHVHTDDPDAATALFDGAGVVSHLDVADMRVQVQQREARLSMNGKVARCGALAVVTGEGMRALFESFGVRTLDGGPTLNPSTYELLAAIHAVDAEQVVVLPNSPNVVMAADRAAALSDKTVSVVGSHSPQAGLAAAVSLDPGRTAARNAKAMEETIERVRTGAVAPAARDDANGRFRQGDAVGFVDDEIVVWGRPRDALRGVLERLAIDADLITCLRGADAPLDNETVHALAQGDVEFELSDGGQKSYWWLLSAE